MRRGIVAFTVFVVVISWAGVILYLHSDQQRDIASTLRANANLARTFEEHTIRTIKQIDQLVLLVSAEYQHAGRKLDLSQFARETSANRELVVIIAVLDERGDPVVTDIAAPRANVADRDHFQFHAKHDSGKLFIGKPVMGRLGGRWLMPMSRRINKPDGSFGGVVSIGVDPLYFANFYRDIDLGTEGVVTLGGRDGFLRARLSGHEFAAGQDVRHAAIVHAVERNEQGSVTFASVVDGVRRLWSYRRVRDYPLYVAVGVSENEALATHNDLRRTTYLATSMVTLVFLALCGWLLQTANREHRARAAVGTANADIQALNEKLLSANSELEHRVAERTAEVEAANGSLRASEGRFRALFEHSATGLSCIDIGTGRFVMVNERLCEITGYSEAELLARTFTDITYPDDRAEDITEIRRQLIEQKRDAYQVEKRCLRKDGSIRWLDISVRLFPAAGDAPLLALASIVDVTERKEAELALKAADRRKDEFLATLAHELRNPLAPLRSGVEVLKLRGDDRTTVAKVLLLMERQIAHMVRLIDDLLDVSRIATGRLQLQTGAVNINDVVNAAKEACQSHFDAAQHKVFVSVEKTPLIVKGDATRLIQAVENLLINAAKFTDHGGEITLRAFRRDSKVVISVRDTGIGIPPAKLPVIFDMFSQVHGSRGSSRDRGLGLGLHVVKRLVELHGGMVVARSDGEGRGSEFVIELPRLEQSSAVAPTTTRPMIAKKRLSILAVDDNPDAGEALAALLDILGHDVRTAFSGQEALNAIGQRTPDVVLLDIGMPEMDGYEVAQRIRGMPLAKQPFVVAVSGWGQSEDKKRTAEAGFDRHLVKPVGQAELNVALAEACRNVH